MFNLITDRESKNPAIASRLAKRWEAAKEITRDGYYFLPEIELGYVTVCKPKTGWAYTIILTDTFDEAVGCNCPDFQKHGDFCKHTLAYQGRTEILMEIEAEACGMDVDTYRRWMEREETEYQTC